MGAGAGPVSVPRTLPGLASPLAWEVALATCTIITFHTFVHGQLAHSTNSARASRFSASPALHLAPNALPASQVRLSRGQLNRPPNSGSR